MATRQFVFVVLLTVMGCKGQGLPADPLFATQRPVESKASAGPAVDVPYSEPTPPVRRFVFGPR